MTNAKISMTMSKIPSDSRSSAVENGSLFREQSANSHSTPKPHIAAAAAIDELLASEARANMQRARVSTREEPIKAKVRFTVPPARIVARPLQSPAWRAPFFSLAIVVGLSTLVSAGAIAYLLLRPITSSTVSDAGIRNIRDSVAQLRRQVADMTNDVATSRAAAEAARTQAAQQASRAQDRAEREQAALAAKSTRIAEEKPPVMQATATLANAPDITGTVQPQAQRPASTSREVIPGWHVRRAYDGAAVLEGKTGVIEVVPGQDVPALGRVQEIKNENNRWQVLTSRGVILSGR
jgi:outer membrane murein-binding lipoprotein Lpp